MKKILTGLTLGALVIAGAAGFAKPVHAEGEEASAPRTEISISPTMSAVMLYGGDTIAKGSDKCPQELAAGCAIEVKNSGDLPYDFRIHVTPYSVSGENNEVSFNEDASNSYSQISRWITFLGDNGSYVDEYKGHLNPGETRTVYYRITIPDDIPGGVQYAAIWAQAIENGAGGNVQTTGEAGMTIRGLSSSDTKRTGTIEKYGFQRFSVGGSLEAHATVKNTGNTDYAIGYKYVARTFFGKELHSETGTIAAWPGTEYNVKVNWKDTPLLGVFNVEFLVNAADTAKSERHVVVVMPVFIMILLILLLTVIGIWIIIIVRKRKERKARTLV